MKNHLLLLMTIAVLKLTACCDDDAPCQIVKSKQPCNSLPAIEPTEIFKVVEEMPTFPGCDSIQDLSARRKCAEEKMLTFISDNLIYPPSALAVELQGTVYLKFVVEEDGCVSGIEIVGSLRCDCDQEAYRVVELMPDWNPGKQRGKPVRTQFNLPVKFEL